MIFLDDEPTSSFIFLTSFQLNFIGLEEHREHERREKNCIIFRTIATKFFESFLLLQSRSESKIPVVARTSQNVGQQPIINFYFIGGERHLLVQISLGQCQANIRGREIIVPIETKWSRRGGLETYWTYMYIWKICFEQAIWTPILLLFLHPSMALFLG